MRWFFAPPKEIFPGGWAKKTPNPGLAHAQSWGGSGTSWGQARQCGQGALVSGWGPILQLGLAHSANTALWPSLALSFF